MNWQKAAFFSSLSSEDLTLLNQFGFDGERFLQLRQDLLDNRFSKQHNRTTLAVKVPHRHDMPTLPVSGNPTYEDCQRRGMQALASQEVASCILNGGMATRFGGMVKGCVEVLPKKSFLYFKINSLPHAQSTVFIMNSFATDEATQEHFRNNQFFGRKAEDIVFCTQSIAPRLTETGDLFRDASGKISFYAPGHADVLAAVGNTAAFAHFVEHGGKIIFISNVDNINATLDPVVIGHHLLNNPKVTAEVAEHRSGDKGGAPVFHNNHLEIMEVFRFPEHFNEDLLPAFSTNSFVLDVSCFTASLPMHYYRADKVVNDCHVVQFERLIGEITAFYDAQFLQVPREGPHSRFFPVKTQSDLIGLRKFLQQHGF